MKESQTSKDLERAQHVRFRRWLMAVVAYSINFIAVVSADLLGMAEMPVKIFIFFFLFGLVGNMVFLLNPIII